MRFNPVQGKEFTFKFPKNVFQITLGPIRYFMRTELLGEITLKIITITICKDSQYELAN